MVPVAPGAPGRSQRPRENTGCQRPPRRGGDRVNIRPTQRCARFGAREKDAAIVISGHESEMNGRDTRTGA